MISTSSQTEIANSSLACQVSAMGKQVQFYMTHEDEKNFLASISDLAPVRLIYQVFADPSHMEAGSLKPVERREENVHYCPNAHLCLVNRMLTAAPKIDSYPKMMSSVDKAESEIVEFNRCEVEKAWLTLGRLWFTEQTMNGRKSDAFISWANSIIKWVRGNYKRTASGHYVAPNALELSKAGKLQLGSSGKPELSLEERKRILGMKKE